MKRTIILIGLLLGATACQPAALNIVTSSDSVEAETYPWAPGFETDGDLTATTISETFADNGEMLCTVRLDNVGTPVTRRLAVNFFTPGGEHMVDMTSTEYRIPNGSIVVEHTAPGSFGPQIDDDFTCSPSWVPEG